MQVTELNDVKVYNLTAGKSLPQFIEEAKKTSKSLRYNEEYKKRIDIIQDFEFKVASARVKVSPNGRNIVASGIYGPEVRIFDAFEMGMKCSRGLNCEVVDFLYLSDDWKKMVFLLDDRTVEFHAQYGFHHRLRVPKAGRTVGYDPESCSLLVGGSSNEIVRIDLEVGTFQTPIAMKELEEVHQVAVNPVLPIVTCAGNQGIVESYDLRNTSSRLRSLQAAPMEGDETGHATCCAYSPTGMHLAVGTSTGLVRVFDIRSSKPLAQRDHMNGFAIRSVSFTTRCGSNKSEDMLVGSCDSKSVKIWEACTAKLAASVENKETINQLEFCPNSGMFFTANDAQRIGVYFAPSLGLAPTWCSFLDSITEELEESTKKTVFDDYQFVTTDELEQLGATELVGTKFLQPYMHGFFMDIRLHGKLKAALDPFRYEDYRKEKIREKVDAKRTMRTKIKDSKVGVNKDLHENLQKTALQGEGAGASKRRKASAEQAKALLEDPRWHALFEDPEFMVEENISKAPNPVSNALQKTRKRKPRQ